MGRPWPTGETSSICGELALSEAEGEEADVILAVLTGHGCRPGPSHTTGRGSAATRTARSRARPSSRSSPRRSTRPGRWCRGTSKTSDGSWSDRLPYGSLTSMPRGMPARSAAPRPRPPSRASAVRAQRWPRPAGARGQASRSAASTDSRSPARSPPGMPCLPSSPGKRDEGFRVFSGRRSPTRGGRSSCRCSRPALRVRRPARTRRRGRPAPPASRRRAASPAWPGRSARRAGSP